MSMIDRELKGIKHKHARGSLTVEAAIIVPVVFLCILWVAEGAITLYCGTVEIVENQEMWEGFHPAKEFRKLEFLEQMIGAADMGGKEWMYHIGKI